jgi:hypothetical protein
MIGDAISEYKLALSIDPTHFRARQGLKRLKDHRRQAS